MSESVQRVVAILDLLRVKSGLSIREIAHDTGIAKSTVQRLLADLAESRLVERDHGQAKYRLGPLCVSLGAAYRANLDLSKLALPILREVRDLYKETAGISVAVGHRRMFVEEMQSQSELRYASELGKQYPLWSGAPGRILMLDLTPAEVADVLADVAGSDTVDSPPEHDQLLDRLAQARRAGHARAFDETIAGVSSLAVPIRDASMSIVAALSISGPSGRLTGAHMDDVLPGMFSRAVELSARLGAPTG